MLDQRKGVYIHPVTGDEISIGDAVKRGIVQVQAVSSQIAEQISSASSHSNVSIRIEPQVHTSRPAHGIKRETEIIEIESFPREPRRRRHHHTTTEEEIIEEHTTNVVDQEVYVTRPRSSERIKQRQIEEVVIDDRVTRPRPGPIDIKEERQYIHEEVHIDTVRPRPPIVQEEIITNGSHREHVNMISQ